MSLQPPSSDKLTDIIQQVRDTYNAAATVYDQATMAFQHAVVYPEIITCLRRGLQNLRQAHVLDVGCGSGRLMKTLQEQGAVCAGVDLSPTFVQMAQSQGLHVQEGSMLHLPFSASEFSAAVMSFVLNYVPADAQFVALQEVWRVLRPGGVVVIAYMHPSLMRITYKGGETFAPQPSAPDYFHPQEVLTIQQVGHNFTLYLLDWPEISNLVIRSGLRLEYLLDPAPPQNLSAFIQQAPTPELQQLVRGFQYNPYGIFLQARKPAF